MGSGVSAGGGADWPRSAASTTWKKVASSAMLPRRFHWSPESEISSPRETFFSTIHFWSVVSSLKVKTLPLACRTRHSRFSGGIGEPDGVVAGGVSAGAAGALVAVTGGSVASPGFSGTVTTSAFFFTLNRCPQFEHLTVSPASVTWASSKTYWARQRSQRTSIGNSAQSIPGSDFDASEPQVPKN